MHVCMYMHEYVYMNMALQITHAVDVVLFHAAYMNVCMHVHARVCIHEYEFTDDSQIFSMQHTWMYVCMYMHEYVYINTTLHLTHDAR